MRRDADNIGENVTRSDSTPRTLDVLDAATYATILDAAERSAGLLRRYGAHVTDDDAHDAAHDAVADALANGATSIDVDTIARTIGATLKRSQRASERITTVLRDAAGAPRSDVRNARRIATADVAALTSSDVCALADTLAFSTFSTPAEYVPGVTTHGARKSPRVSAERVTTPDKYVNARNAYATPAERSATFNVAGVEHVDTRTADVREDHARAVLAGWRGVDVRTVRNVTRDAVERVTGVTTWRADFRNAERGDMSARAALAPIDTRTPHALADAIRRNAWRGNATFASIHAANVENAASDIGPAARLAAHVLDARWNVSTPLERLAALVAVRDAATWTRRDTSHDAARLQHVDALAYGPTLARVHVATLDTSTPGTSSAPVNIGPRIRTRQSGVVANEHAVGVLVSTWQISTSHGADIASTHAARLAACETLADVRTPRRNGGRGRPSLDVLETLDGWAHTLDVRGIGNVDVPRLTLAPSGVSTFSFVDVLTALADDAHVFASIDTSERRNVAGVNVAALADAYNATRGERQPLDVRRIRDALTTWRTRATAHVYGAHVETPHVSASRRLRAIARTQRNGARVLDTHGVALDAWQRATWAALDTPLRVQGVDVLTGLARDAIAHAATSRRQGVGADLPRTASVRVPSERWRIAWRLAFGHDAARIANVATWHDARTPLDVLAQRYGAGVLDVSPTWRYVATPGADAVLTRPEYGGATWRRWLAGDTSHVDAWQRTTPGRDSVTLASKAFDVLAGWLAG